MGSSHEWSVCLTPIRLITFVITTCKQKSGPSGAALRISEVSQKQKKAHPMDWRMRLRSSFANRAKAI